MITLSKLPKSLFWLTYTPEYQAVADFYEGRVAKRSQVPYMNHIVEGAIILDALNYRDVVVQAFCLHPLCQADKDFMNFDPSRYDVHAVALAIEYRHIANNYLSHCTMPKDGIKLSPSDGVNHMLIADKVQNYKDFLLYHRNTHPNSKRLEEYFNEWLAALKVDGLDNKSLIDWFDLIGYRS